MAADFIAGFERALRRRPAAAPIVRRIPPRVG
jgi:hypothetical protein